LCTTKDKQRPNASWKKTLEPKITFPSSPNHLAQLAYAQWVVLQIGFYAKSLSQATFNRQRQASPRIGAQIHQDNGLIQRYVSLQVKVRVHSADIHRKINDTQVRSSCCSHALVYLTLRVAVGSPLSKIMVAAHGTSHECHACHAATIQQLNVLVQGCHSIYRYPWDSVFCK
jgi:hypothetical protein